ncbi:hypothetical protein Tco_0910695 [Tanacetum coccineum]|uniref:Retrovirus-related Pol polyprotein from transposon TNT 1-94 n=1 Tax=Tanacetum coccineum TaxID=301880 RepID=A0ABQ5CTL2_9ASTR
MVAVDTTNSEYRENWAVKCRSCTRAGQRKPEGQWIGDERKDTNLDQRLKSLIMYVLPDDQMNSVINCLTAKSTWDDLILYHEGPTDDFQDSPDDEEDTRSSHEYLNDLEEVYQTRALLAKSKRFFKKGTQRFSSAKTTDQTECHKYGKKHKPKLRPTKDFEAKYKKVKAKLALLSSSALASKAITIKNKGLIVEAYKWDEEEVSSDENEMVEVKVLMTLAEENDAIRNEQRCPEWISQLSHKENHNCPPITITDSSAMIMDLADESSVL